MSWNPFKRSKPPQQESGKKSRRSPMFKLKSPQSRGLFSASEYDHNNSGWDATAVPIGQVIDRKLLSLVARSREQVSNNDYARGFVREVRKNVWGPKGIQLQVRGKDPSGSLDAVANEAIERAYKKWCRRENCSVDGRLDYVRLGRTVLNTAVGSGESFIRFVEGDAAGPWGFSLQVIDPLRVPVGINDTRLRNGNVIRHGIEMTPYGRPVAMLVETKAGVLADPFKHSGKEFERVPAADILHIYDMEQAEQFRGLPWTHSSLTRMKNVAGYEEASVVNARAGASKTMVLKADPDVYEADEDEEEPEFDLEPNSVVVLPPGYEPVDYSPDFPSAETAAFIKSQLRGTASGWGVAYNSIANDLEGVNFSSIRQGKLDERDGWKDLQEWFIEAFCRPIYERWLEYSLLSGKIVLPTGNALNAGRYEKFLDVEWQPRRWEWVDPLKEEKAISEAQSNGRKSPSEAIRESGRDPDAVWQAYADDIAAMRTKGIPDNFIFRILGLSAIAPSDGEEDGQEE